MTLSHLGTPISHALESLFAEAQSAALDLRVQRGILYGATEADTRRELERLEAEGRIETMGQIRLSGCYTMRAKRNGRPTLLIGLREGVGADELAWCLASALLANVLSADGPAAHDPAAREAWLCENDREEVVLQYTAWLWLNGDNTKPAGIFASPRPPD